MTKVLEIKVICKCNNCNKEQEYERNISKEEFYELLKDKEYFIESIMDDYIHTCPNTDEEGYYDVYDIKRPLDKK